MYTVSLVFLISIREISTQKPLLRDSCRMLQINFIWSWSLHLNLIQKWMKEPKRSTVLLCYSP